MRALLAAAALAMSTPAFGQTAPAVQPTRDVDVTYRVPVPGAPGTYLLQRLRWSAAHRQQRVDLPTAGNWMVLDFNAHRMALVHDESREIIDLPSPQGADQAGAGAGYTRVAAADVAGMPCTEWRTVDTRGAETLACYTNDGVLLRARSGTRVLMEALHVTYEAQAESVFQTPAGYSRQSTSR